MTTLFPPETGGRVKGHEINLAVQMNPFAQKQRLTLINSILLFLLLAGTIAAVGYRAYRNFEKNTRAEAEDWLSAIGDAKAGGLKDWRFDILSDAGLIHQNKVFYDTVSLYFTDTGNTTARDNVLAWLEGYGNNDEFDQVHLLDADGNARLSLPEGSPLSEKIREQIPEAARIRQVKFVDFYQNESDDKVSLAILVPILDGTDNNAPIGFVSLQIDPNIRLYPYVARKTANNTAVQSFLIRREEGVVVFLTPFRFESEATLNLSVPLNDQNNVAVKAALGQQGILEGSDYYGVPITAMAQSIPGSPWILITYIDTIGVNAPIREYFWGTIIVAGTIILYSGLGLVLVWRQRQLKYFQAEAEAAEALRKTEEELRTLTQQLDSKVRERTEQLRALSQQMVDMQEKQIQNLARELHDSVGQNLTAINLNLSLIGQLLTESSPESLRARIADTSGIVEETVGRMRNIMADFLPPMLETYGLTPTLSWYGEQFTKRTNIPLAVRDTRTDPTRLPLETEIGLFRITQEALSNTAKYARASQADITLQDDGDSTLMIIADNGIGFDPDTVLAETSHWGFAIMRERARAIDAEFDAQSSPGNGTTILLRLFKFNAKPPRR
ncbi:MAG: sensor histidine kinase [Chloroflexi bacterium]|nr:sensor histidine kinase [Chloroflexota bacterium]